MDPESVPATRPLARARELLDVGKPAEAAELLRQVGAGDGSAEFATRVARLRVHCVRGMVASAPPDVVWRIIEDIYTLEPMRADPVVQSLAARCIGRAMSVLELGEAEGANLSDIVLWRRRLAVLSPEKRHNWSMLVSALIRTGQHDEAESLLVTAEAEATGEAEDARVEAILLQRVALAVKGSEGAPAELAWDRLEAIDVTGFAAAEAARTKAQIFCAARAAEGLEAAQCLLDVDWQKIVQWRFRIAALGPERRHNWYRLVLALTYGGWEDEATRIKATIEPSIAELLAEHIGDAPAVVSALRRSTEAIFRREAPRYLRRALPVVPCLGELPIFPGWRQYNDEMPEPGELERWMELPWAQIALVLGQRSGLGAVSISLRDPALADRLIDALPPTPWRKTSNDTVSLLFRRGDVDAFRGPGEDRAAYVYHDDVQTMLLPPSIQTFDGTRCVASADLLDVLDEIPELRADAAELLAALLPPA